MVSGMNGTLADKLLGKRRVHLDTQAVIYFILQNPTYVPIVRPIFEMINGGQLSGISSYVTLLEVMVHPIRENRPDLARSYRDVLLQADNFTLFPLDQVIAEEGASIRARYGFGTPDAVQLATAVHRGADVYVTNDHRLKRFRQVEVLVIDDFLSGNGGTQAGRASAT